MTRRRLYPLVFCVVLFASALVTWIAFGRSTDERAFSPWAENAGAKETVCSSPSSTGVATSSPAVAPAPQLTQEEVVVSPVLALTPEASAQLSEQIELNGLAEQAGLNLTSQELKTFAEITSEHLAIRDAYELAISTVEWTPEGAPRMEVPLYPLAGDALRADFYDALRRALGDSVVARITAKLGRQLESRFAGFGVTTQVIDLAVLGSENSEEPVLTRTAVYWNSLGATERLVTKKETSFLILENANNAYAASFHRLLEASSSQKL